MKKLLIASTALVATASVAAADVTFGGFGRFGLFYQERADDSAYDDTRIEQRLRLNINVSAETDGGVRFGGRLRFQSDEESDTGRTGVADNSAAEFNVRAGGLRVDVGNTSDVLDSGDIFDYFGSGVGLTSFGEISSGFDLPASGFGTGDSAVDPTVKASYSSGPFTVAASYTSNSIDDFDAAGESAGAQEDEWQIGVGYSITDDIRIGAVYGEESLFDEDDRDFFAIGGGATFGAATVNVVVADIDDSSSEEIDTAWGLSVAYAVGAATSLRFAVNDAGRNDTGGSDGDVGDEVAYAVGVQHSLGGGVSLRGGVGENRFGDVVGDLGVRFDF